jgi:hypothetical protein
MVKTGAEFESKRRKHFKKRVADTKHGFECVPRKGAVSLAGESPVRGIVGAPR